MKKRPAGKDRNDDTPDEARAVDAEHFVRAMADVVPLAQDPRGRVRSTPSISTPRAATESPSPDATSERAEGSDDSFVAPGVDQREIRKLKRGDYVPARRLDLHGLTAAKAIASVTRFIDSARHNRDTPGLQSRTGRCVCIVHGRGLHSEGNVSILRTRVRECLREHRSVLAYADAPRADGGSGAVYVLLRKSTIRV